MIYPLLKLILTIFESADPDLMLIIDQHEKASNELKVDY